MLHYDYLQGMPCSPCNMLPSAGTMLLHDVSWQQPQFVNSIVPCCEWHHVLNQVILWSLIAALALQHCRESKYHKP